MKKTIAKIYRINTGWWDSFTSCFVGTLLGIVITFGISGYISRAEHRKNDRTMQIIAVGKIEENVMQLKLHANELKRTDSLCSRMLSYYPDSLDLVPARLVVDFLQDIEKTRSAFFDHSVSNIMLGNAEIWESMSPAAITVLDKTLLLTGYLMEVLKEVQEEKKTLNENLSLKHYSSTFRTIQDASRAIFEDPQNVYLLSEIPALIRHLNAMLPSCDSVLLQVKTNMNITDKDFEILKDGRYKGFRMLDDGMMAF